MRVCCLLLTIVAAIYTAEVRQPVHPSNLGLDAKATLGKQLFFEARLSNPQGQSCATCHSPKTGFADPESEHPTSNGARTGVFGPRNAPSVAYASFSPPLHWDPIQNIYIGGQFLDGRVDTLEQQAELPFLNPLEMHQFRKRDVIDSMLNAGLGNSFLRVYGLGSLALDTDAQVNDVFLKITEAIAAYERSSEVNRFSSKFDRFLKRQAQLTAIERHGMELFNGKAFCFVCHTSTTQANHPGPLFTDFSYHNIGTPKNWLNLFLYMPPSINPEGATYIDFGLGETIAELYPQDAKWEHGKFKTPTLRNIAQTAPYGHNGVFKSLKEVVHFYNTRDVPEEAWPPAEASSNISPIMGNLGLTEQEEDAIVAFLLTLTDE